MPTVQDLLTQGPNLISYVSCPLRGILAAEQRQQGESGSASCKDGSCRMEEVGWSQLGLLECRRKTACPGEAECVYCQIGSLPLHGHLVMPTERTEAGLESHNKKAGSEEILQERNLSFSQQSLLQSRLQKVLGPGGDRMHRAQELALVEPFSPHCPTLGTLVRPPSVAGPEGLAAYSWHRQQGEAPSRVLQSLGCPPPPCRECVKYWTVLPAHRCLGVHLLQVLLLVPGCMSVCVPPCGSVQACTGSVCVEPVHVCRAPLACLYAWYTCVCLFPSCTLALLVSLCMFVYM